MLSRRDVMGKLAASGAVLLVASGARASLAPAARHSADGSGAPPAPDLRRGAAQDFRPEVDAGPPATAAAEAPWDLIRPLAMGSVVAGGWRVAGFTGAVNGTCVLTLQNERGRAQRVHLCRNDGRPQGLVYTDRFDLVVMNGGQGDEPTDEGLARAVATIARRLSANGSGRQAEVVAALLPHAERVQRVSGAGLR